MDKILFIGHLLEGHSGWARASHEYIRSLSTQFNVVARPVVLNQRVSPPNDILDCINKTIDNIKYCIQHVLPHYIEYSSNFDKNVGIVILESTNLATNDWCRRINLLDEGIIPYDYLDEAITIPLRKVPHAVNDNRYMSKQNINLPPGYNFYTIADFTVRKNIGALLRAFHTEFTINEPVNLIIKTSKFNTSEQDCLAQAIEEFGQLKSGLKVYTQNLYKDEIIITNKMSDAQINGLHQACDCFVDTSYGEAWNWGAFDSMAHGNTVIAPAIGGPIEYLKHYDNKILLSSRKEPCFGAIDSFENIYTSHEYWDSIDIISLQRGMRQAYDTKKKSISTSRHVSKKFSYENVGHLFKSALEA